MNNIVIMSSNEHSFNISIIDNIGTFHLGFTNIKFIFTDSSNRNEPLCHVHIALVTHFIWLLFYLDKISHLS